MRPMHAVLLAIILVLPTTTRAWHQIAGAEEQLFCEEIGLYASCNETHSGTSSIACSKSPCDAPAPERCPSAQIPNSDKSVTGSIFGVIGSQVTVTCDAGYVGSGVVVCAFIGYKDFREFVAHPGHSSDITRLTCTERNPEPEPEPEPDGCSDGPCFPGVNCTASYGAAAAT